MDPLIYLSCAAIIVIVLVLIGFLFKTRSNDRAVGDEAEQEGQVRGGVRRDPNVPAGARQRGARRRMAGAHRQQEEDDEEDDLMEDIALPEGKIGARKMRKLQDKAEKRKMREQEQIEREERKKREAELEKRRKQQELEQEKEEARLEAEEAKRKEEQAKREHEEYLKMKAQFVVEESGVTDLEHNLENESLLVQFIDYVKEMKVVMMEDLAAHFNIKTQECIDRIQTLQGDGTLTGVIDDRGKFIYITRDEMDDVAKFIRQRGRVSIAELAQSSNQLINLNPDNKHVAAKLLTTSS